MKTAKKSLALGMLLISTSACTEYWWTRGQPPSASELFERQSVALLEARKTNKFNREELVEIIELVQGSLDRAIKANSSELSGALEETSTHFISLEGKLSIGSRAAFGELSGQLRAFLNKAKDSKEVDRSSLMLFSARTFSLLSNELSVPAPSFG